LALYSSRVRSSDLLGITSSILSGDFLPIYWFFCSISLNDAKGYIVTNLNSGVHPLKYFLRARLDRPYARAFDATDCIAGFTRVCYGNKGGQLAQITCTTCDFELPIYAYFNN
jgi:hypothetical protein